MAGHPGHENETQELIGILEAVVKILQYFAVFLVVSGPTKTPIKPNRFYPTLLTTATPRNRGDKQAAIKMYCVKYRTNAGQFIKNQ
jgi:hypothetical protein